MKYFYLRIILLFVLLQISYVLSAQSINWKNAEKVYVKTSQELSLANAQNITRLNKSAYIISRVDLSKMDSNDVLFVSPIWQSEQGLEQYTIDNSIILYDVYSLTALIRDNNLSTNVISIDSIAGEPLIYIISLRNMSYKQIDSICAVLMAESYCKIAEPNYVFLNALQDDISPDPENNTYYANQWGLHNNTYPQYDINAREAWSISTGAGIKVAVIDVGFELAHPDLINNIHSSLDCTDGADGSVNGAYVLTLDSHGTQCAGVIAATNNNIGVVGVAPDSKLILLRRGYTIISGGDTIFYAQNAWHINALRTAYQLGADVISNSWSVNASSNNLTIFDEVLSEAYTLGRAGKGAVVVFSTGNQYKTFINYPSNSPYTISVGAMNSIGHRCAFSNYGQDLDVVAPGYNIWTTQIIPYGSYCYSSGTSFAAPMVAGVVALMLSANPNITSSEVGNIIRSTAYKLPEYDFNIPAQNGGWNNQVGYGLVDALAAVQMATVGHIEGPQYLGDSAWYYVRNVPQGATITWNISNKYPLPNMYVLASEQGRDSMYIAFRYALDPHPSIPPGIINSIGDNDDPNLLPIVMPQLGYLSVTLTQGNSSYTIKKTIREPESNNPSSMPRLHLATQTEDAVINVQMPVGLDKSLAKNAYSLELWHSIYGRMWTQTVHNFNEQIPVANLLQGVYVLVLKENKNIIAQTKVLVK